MFSGRSNEYRFNQAPGLLEWGGYCIFALPLLLFIPVLYYSLTTPFALVDDYGMCYYVEFLDHADRFQNWFRKQVVDFSYGRYRPVFDLYNMLTWKAFGASPWLHHLARWMLHFGAIACFSAAFLYFRSGGRDDPSQLPEARSRYIQLVPLAILIYIWLFFPNSPASRLGPQEVYTVFFLGLCSLMMAYIIGLNGKDGRGTRVPAALLIHVVLYLSYLGLSWSKEINIAPMLWILIFYYGLVLRKMSWGRIIGGLPLVVIFIYTLRNIITASRNSYYGGTSITPGLLTDNAGWLFRELFQVETSLFITVGFSILLTYLVGLTLSRLVKKEISGHLFFVIFLLGQCASLYLILCTSWAQVLRYWYILIPAFATLLAFSARAMLSAAKEHWRIPSFLPLLLLIPLLILFIGSNYYNFLLQTVAQHSLRKAEAELIEEITALHDQGHHVQILTVKNDPEAELVAHLIAYFHRFSPRFHGRKYRVYANKPDAEAIPYYLVTMHEQPEALEVHRVVEAETDYRLLSEAHKVAEKLQGKPPYLSKDAGVHLLENYRWYIYKAGPGKGPAE